MFLIGQTLNAATLGQFIYIHGDRINHKDFGRMHKLLLEECCEKLAHVK